MSQKKKDLYIRGTGQQLEQTISDNNNPVSVNYEGIDFDTLPVNELLKISTQISLEIEENSKGESSDNNHVNTNVPRLTDRRQVYISPNIDKNTDHILRSIECKTLVETIDTFQNANDDPDTTSEHQKYIQTTSNLTNDGGCNVTTQDKNEAVRTTYQSDNSRANSKYVEEGYNGYSCTASSNDKCQSPTSLSRSPDIMTVHKQSRPNRHEKGDDNRRRHQYQAIEETYKDAEKETTNSHSSEEQINTSRRGEGCEERFDDHLRTCLSSTSCRNDVTGHHKSDERRRSNTRDGDNRFGRRHPPTSSHRNIVHARESDRRRSNTPFENKRPMKRQHSSFYSDNNRSRKYQRMEKEHSSCDKNFISNDSGNCTERRSDLGMNDARKHILTRMSDLGNARKHEPERSDLRNAHTRGPGRMSDQRDEHTHGPRSRLDLRDEHTHGPGSRLDLIDEHTHGSGSRLDLRDVRTHEHRSRLDLIDEHTHGPGSRLDLIDEHTHGPGSRLDLRDVRTHEHRSRLDLRDEHTHGPGSRLDLRDVHTHGPGRKSYLRDKHTHGPRSRLDLRDEHTHGPGRKSDLRDEHTYSPGGRLDLRDEHKYGPGNMLDLRDEHTHCPVRKSHRRDEHTHGAESRLDLRDEHTHGPGNRLDLRDEHIHGLGRKSDLRNEHTHGPGSRLDLRDVHTHGPESRLDLRDEYTHGPGSRLNLRDEYTHGPGSRLNLSDEYTHGPGSRLDLGDEHTHGPGSRLDLRDEYTHGPGSRLDLRDEYTHGPGSRFDLRDEYTHGSGSRLGLRDVKIHGPGSRLDLRDEHTHVPGRSALGDEHTHDPGRRVDLRDEHIHSPACRVDLIDEYTHGPGSRLYLRDEHTHGPGSRLDLRDEHTHGPRRSDLRDEHTHGPGFRLDLRDEHTHGPESRLDRGDTHKQESAYRSPTTNEYSRNYNYNGKRKINNAECDATQHKLSKICEHTSDGRSSKTSRTAEGLYNDARNNLEGNHHEHNSVRNTSNKNNRQDAGKVERNRLSKSSLKIDLLRLSAMDADGLASYLSTYQDDVDSFLLGNKSIENIPLFLEIFARVCESTSHCLVKKALYYLKERKFFDRQDIKETICTLRNRQITTFDEKQINLIKNLMILINGLSLHLKCGPTELLQTLDSLELGVLQKISDDAQKNEIMSLIQTIRDIWDNKTYSVTINKNTSELSILPDISEIEDFEHSNIPEHFDNESEYLTRLFMVHRQDFIRPLCNGLSDLKKDIVKDPFCLSKRWTHDYIRVYRNIQFLSRCCNQQNGVTWKISFNVAHYSNVNWVTRKLLTFGSLVCLTNTSFSFIQYATVAECKPEDLKQGHVEIKFLEHSAISSMLRQTNDIILVESQASFPAYFHALESIKNMHGLVSTKTSKLPFGEQLVSLCVDIEQPEYLRSTSCKDGFDFGCFGSGLGTIDISKEQNWPNASTLRLDDSQYAAFVIAMKSKLALIQGPPGTGKTVVGLKIAELLLSNIHIWRNENEEKDGPFLLISYTNHALDQFLLAITKRVPGLKQKDVVRLGSRTEVQELTQHNLSVLRKDCNSYKTVDCIRGSGLYRRVGTRTIPEVTSECNIIAFDSKNKLNMRIQEHEKLRKMETELLSGIVHEYWFYDVSGVMNEQHYNCTIKPYQEPWTIITWLNVINLLQENVWTSEQTSSDNTIDDGEEFNLFDMDQNTRDDGDDDSENYDNHFTTRQQYRHLDINLLHMAVSSSSIFSKVRNDRSRHFWDNYTDAEKRLFMQKLHDKIQNTTTMSNEVVHGIFDINLLSNEARWMLYKYWLMKSLAPLQKEIQERENSYGKAQEHYKNVQQVADIKILQRAKIIACTTSRAARDIEILKRVSPKIILLEEAAQIPEHHVVSCLTSSCQQLIMIGDHQQLRPAYNDYKTARQYKINISLFERLIRSQFPYRTLQYQHRMRPSISKLLVPHIYRVLCNDESVYHYENIMGVQTNIHFISHSNFEDNEREHASKSHTNSHEASFLCQLYRYLRLQGYTSSQITILSPYLDQIRLLRKIIRPIDEKMSERCPEENWSVSTDFQNRGVRITAVDNFQGEENDIILLSLVRSNPQNRIGYLSEANRICVALSRAKKGLYVIGNFEQLKTKSKLWEKIVDDALKREFLDNRLELICQNHKISTFVTNDVDFNLVVDGGCQKECEFKRNCGHNCSRKCHKDDDRHQKQCIKPCPEELCERGHKCTKTCHFPMNCGLCSERVEKVLPKCKHKIFMPCHKDPSLGICDRPCTFHISCGHRCQRRCTQRCNTEQNCHELVKAIGRCGHEVQVDCCDKYDPPCKIKCLEKLECGHQCSGNCSSCSQGRLHVPCTKRCNRILVCGHLCRDNCNYTCGPCKSICQRRCPHGGKCTRTCSKPCIICREPCNWICTKPCPNAYTCEQVCSKKCDRPKCNTPCIYLLNCFHTCPGLLCETKCIRTCKVCDHDKLTEIFFGTEDEEDAVFIQLEDCVCIFEVTGFDTYVKTNIDNTNGIMSLKCPRCSTRITTSSRYRNELRLINNDIENVFKRMRCMEESIDYHSRRSQVLSIVNQTYHHLDHRAFEKLREQVDRSKSTTKLEMISNSCTFIEQVGKCEAEIMVLGIYPVPLAWAKRLRNWVLMKRDRFSEQEYNEFTLEIRRLSLVIDIHKFKKELIARKTEEEEEEEEELSLTEESTEEVSVTDKITEKELSLIDQRNEKELIDHRTGEEQIDKGTGKLMDQRTEEIIDEGAEKMIYQRTEELIDQRTKEELIDKRTEEELIDKRTEKELIDKITEEELNDQRTDGELIDERTGELMDQRTEEIIDEGAEKMIYQRTEELIDQRTEEELIDKRTEEELIDKRTEEELIDKRTEEELNDQRTDGELIDERTGELMDQRTEEIIDEGAEKMIYQRTEELIDQRTEEELIDKRTEEELIDKRTEEELNDQRTDGELIDERTGELMDQRTEEIMNEGAEKMIYQRTEELIDQGTEEELIDKRTEEELIDKRTEEELIDKRTEEELIDKRTEEELNNQRTDGELIDERTEEIIYQRTEELIDKRTEKELIDEGTEEIIYQRTEELIDQRTDEEPIDMRTEEEENKFPENIQQHLIKLESKTKIKDDELSQMRKDVLAASDRMLGLTLEEKVMIKRAMASEFMGSGHWYKCMNGHYYSIGECGMPMEERKCPQCNVTIGGKKHILSNQNEQAMDMETA